MADKEESKEENRGINAGSGVGKELETQRMNKEVNEKVDRSFGYQSHMGNNRRKYWVVMRYGREAIGINEEWRYTIKLEKSYCGLINKTYVTLLREYLEKMFSVFYKMWHSICLVPFVYIRIRVASDGKESGSS